MPPDPTAGPAPPAPAVPAPEEQRRRPGRRRAGWAGWLLLAGALVQLAPFVLFPVVLTQDGPAHVDAAWVLLHHGDPGAVGSALRSAFTVDLTPVPNMLGTFVLAGLMSFLSPDAAEKVLVVALVALLVGGLRYALRGVDPRAGWLAVVAVPLAGSQLVVYGFYNFCLGVALALISVGVALRARSEWRPGATAGLGVLLLLTWTAHLLPWLAAAGAVGALALGRAAEDRRGGDDVRVVAGRHLLRPLLAVLPSLALTAAYTVTHGSSRGAAEGGFGWGRLAELLSLASPLVVHGAAEVVSAVLVAVVVGGLLIAAIRHRQPREGDGEGDGIDGGRRRSDRRVLGALAVLAAVAFLVTPARLGTDYGFLPQRLAWFPVLLVTLFCATRLPRSRRVQVLAAATVVLAACAAVVVRLPTDVREARLTQQALAAADRLPPGATFVVLRYGADPEWARLPGGPDALQHVSGRLAVRAGAVDAGLYEAVYPYFQVAFTPAGDLRRPLDPTLFGLEKVPPDVALSTVRGRLGYVVLLGLDPGTVGRPARTDHVLAELTGHYRQVWRGSGSGSDVSVWAARSAR